MDDVASGVQAWDSRIANTQGRQINLHLFWYEFGTTGNDQYILGGSYSPTYGAAGTSWTYAEHVWRDGVDYDAPFDGFDSYIQYDVTAGSTAWNFGTGSPGTNQIDFRSVITHELGHTVGFYDSYYYNPSYPTYSDKWGNTWGTASSPYAWAGYGGLSMWDKNLEDASRGNRPINGGTGTPGNFKQTANPVYWDGASAVSYYGGLVPIYAPTSFAGGSSLSHLDENTPRTAGDLMSPMIATKEVVRAPTELDWAMMKDMGWDIRNTPEPASLLALVAGLALFRARRRKKA